MFCSNPLRLFLICMCSLLHIKHCALQVNQTTQRHCIVCPCICVCLILAHAQQPHPHPHPYPTPSNTAVSTEPEPGCWQREAEHLHEGQWGGVPVTERWRVTGWESFSRDRKIPPGQREGAIDQHCAAAPPKDTKLCFANCTTHSRGCQLLTAVTNTYLNICVF